MKTVIRAYGFRHGRSCVTNLLSFYLRVMNVHCRCENLALKGLNSALKYIFSEKVGSQNFEIASGEKLLLRI